MDFSTATRAPATSLFQLTQLVAPACQGPWRFQACCSCGSNMPLAGGQQGLLLHPSYGYCIITSVHAPGCFHDILIEPMPGGTRHCAGLPISWRLLFALPPWQWASGPNSAVGVWSQSIVTVTVAPLHLPPGREADWWTATSSMFQLHLLICSNTGGTS